jgi:hypothetical protein
MDTLLDYLKSLPRERREPFAAGCRTTFAYLRQIAYGNRVCRESMAIHIERESGRVVRCEDLRPDIDWAFLRADSVPPASQQCRRSRLPL